MAAHGRAATPASVRNSDIAAKPASAPLPHAASNSRCIFFVTRLDTRLSGAMARSTSGRRLAAIEALEGQAMLAREKGLEVFQRVGITDDAPIDLHQENRRRTMHSRQRDREPDYAPAPAADWQQQTEAGPLALITPRHGATSRLSHAWLATNRIPAATSRSCPATVAAAKQRSPATRGRGGARPWRLARHHCEPGR